MPSAASPSSRKSSILYVDDEADLLDIGKIFLERSGEVSVSTMTSAEEALKTPLQVYDLIISDYQMPRMDGITFLKEVRERFGDIPFILFTGRGREEVVIDAINNGADFYLQKGGNPKAQFAELQHKIQQAVRRKQAERSLRESEKRLLDIIDFLPDPTIATDREGKVIAWNRAVQNLTGLSADAVLGRSDFGYAVPLYGTPRPLLINMMNEPDEKIAEFYPSFTRTDDTISSEVDFIRPDGRRIVAMIKVCPLYDPDGEVTGAIETFREITQNKINEEELKRSEERYRSIVNDQTEMITRFTPDGTINFCNESFRRYYAPDRSYEEIIGKNIFQIMHIPDPAGVMAYFADLTRENPGKEIERVIPGADGNTWQLWYVCELFDQNGNLYELQVVGRDITAWKKAEIALRESNEIFRTFVELSLDGTIIMDFSGRFLFVSPAAGRILGGLTPEELIGRNATEFVLPEYLEQLQKDIAHATRNKGSNFVRYRLNLEKETWVECIGRGIPYKQSEAILVSIRDITERKQAEEMVQQSETKFFTIFENCPVAMTMVSAEDGRFVDVNLAFSENTGYTRDEIIGRTAEELGLFPDQDEQLLMISSIREKGTLSGLEVTCRRKGGEIRNCRFSSRLIRMGGRVQSISTIEDITEKKSSEMAFQAMIRGMIGSTGRESLWKIVEAVQVWLHADCVLIGEIQADRRTVKCLAMIQDGKRIENYSYQLRGTACEKMIKRGYVQYTDDAVHLFPESSPLREFRVRGYIGVPFTGSTGSVFGFLCILFRQQIQPPRGVQQIVEIIAVKAAAEIERFTCEYALDKSQEQLAEAMDLAQLVNWEYDIDTDLFTFNDRFYALYRTDAERMGGYLISSEKYAEVLVHPEDQDLVAEEIDKAVHSSDPGYFSVVEHRIICGDGEIRYISVRIVARKDESGRTVQTYGVNQDITSQRRTKTALKLANKQLGLLSEITRHDILNKVTVILAYLYTMGVECSDPALLKYLTRMEDAIKMIQSQIEFTKIYQDIGTLDPQWMKLREIIGDLAVPDSVYLSSDLTHLSVYADPMLEKVFSNLVENSLQHGERVTQITITCEKTGNDLLLIYADNGVGIPDEDKERIFERGFGKHTGLGMFLSRDILSLTGLTIQETGRYGTGARFEISVPRDAFRFDS